MPDERYKQAFDAAMEDVEKIRVAYVEAQKKANIVAVSLYGVPAPFKDADVPVAATAQFTIRPDQFANYAAPSEAARAFLTMRGPEQGAIDIEAILDGLGRGGFTFTTSKSERVGGLAKAMGKDKLVRKLDNGTYGLWEWYPKAKRDRETKKSGEKDVEAEEEAPEGVSESPSESPAPPSVEPPAGEK